MFIFSLLSVDHFCFWCCNRFKGFSVSNNCKNRYSTRSNSTSFNSFFGLSFSMYQNLIHSPVMLCNVTLVISSSENQPAEIFEVVVLTIWEVLSIHCVLCTSCQSYSPTMNYLFLVIEGQSWIG